MTITELGAIGEFLSSLVVLATLVYLAIQVRQAKLSVQSSSWQTGIQSLMDVNGQIASDPVLAEIFQRGMADPDVLNPLEQFRMSMLLASLFHTYHKWYLDHEKGIVDSEAWLGEEASMLSLLSQPGVARWWREFGVPYTPGFRAYVDARLAESGGEEVFRYSWDEPLSSRKSE